MGKSLGVFFQHGSLRGAISQDYDFPSLRRMLQQGSTVLDQPEVELIAAGRNRIGVVSLKRDDDQELKLVVKEFRLVGIDRLKTFFLPSKARRAWQGAKHLIDSRIPTPSPVAFIEVRKGRLVKQAFFITKKVAEAVEIRGLLRERHGEELKLLLKELADFLRLLHQKKILHRDLSDGNILVKENEGQREFYLLDTNRLRKKRRLSTLVAVKSLIRVGVPAAYQKFFLQCYFGQPHPPFFWWGWYKIAKETFNVYLRIKNFLGLRKLVQRLRLQ